MVTVAEFRIEAGHGEGVNCFGRVDPGMAQSLIDALNSHPVRQPHRCCGVAERVEPNAKQFVDAQEALESSIEHRRGHRAHPVSRCDDICFIAAERPPVHLDELIPKGECELVPNRDAPLA